MVAEHTHGILLERRAPASCDDGGDPQLERVLAVGAHSELALGGVQDKLDVEAVAVMVALRDALDGAPGVYSARYGSADLDDEGRYQHLLAELRPFPDPSQRNARFRCAISAISPDGRRCRAEGTCEGIIAHSPIGSNGFGYDPIFLVAAHNSTMAQLDAATKNSISHRGQALAAIIPLLKNTFPELYITAS